MDPAVGFSELQPLVNGFTHLCNIQSAIMHLHFTSFGRL